MKINVFFTLLLTFPILLFGQYNHEFVHFDLKGDVLLEQLRDDFSPDLVLDYGNARDTLFTIMAVNDTLSGIYTDMKLYMDPSLDPTQAVYLNGNNNGINTEHVYPRSKGAKSGNAKSDMHHLFPSRSKTNADRGNLPFGEINDSATKRWYYMKNTRTSKPTQFIDKYSEWIDARFEPRESKKGDIARAMFYFFTIYHDEALAADPDFFKDQRAALCQWHMQDPIDSVEWARSERIKIHQDGLANPFVLDCSLAQRAYCPEIIEVCYPDAAIDIEIEKSVVLQQNHPNPFNNNTTIPIVFSKPGHAFLSVHSILDQNSIVLLNEEVSVGELNIDFSKDFAEGIYIYRLLFTASGHSDTETYVFKMIKQ